MIPLLPLVGFAILALAGRRLTRTGIASVGAGFCLAAFVVSAGCAVAFLLNPEGGAIRSELWTLLDVSSFRSSVSLRWDELSLVMTLVITFVGSLILLYSTCYMSSDTGFSRFFAYMNLFVGSMVLLVLSEDLLVLFMAWEGVGLCSFLLIGFWYHNPDNVRAARKAFLVTRVGDTLFLLGIIWLISDVGFLKLPEILRGVEAAWYPDSPVAVGVSLLLLAGAIGKSAQLPLQTWLPDAMAGPTPVSALIHAATMVTAGVYLVARMHPVFLMAPSVLQVIAIIGTMTLVLASISALVQTDIKRVMAYSTMSQVGYMFLGLGVGAWSAAIFHFMVHAFFKSLLFLGAGVVIRGCRGEHDLRRLGGLRHCWPVTFWCFVAGAASLSSLPLLTAGFYSKDWILLNVAESERGGWLLWGAGLAGAFLTALYAFRMVFLAFCGPLRREPLFRPGWLYLFPMVLLAILSLGIGFLEIPSSLGGVSLFSKFLAPVFAGEKVHPHGLGMEILLHSAAVTCSVLGFAVACLVFGSSPDWRRKWERFEIPKGARDWIYSGFGFERFYARWIADPFESIATWLRSDPVDFVTGLPGAVCGILSKGLSWSQTGVLRWYLVAGVLGVLLSIAVGVYL